MSHSTHNNDGSLHTSGHVGNAFVNNYLCPLCNATVEDEASLGWNLLGVMAYAKAGITELV